MTSANQEAMVETFLDQRPAPSPELVDKAAKLSQLSTDVESNRAVIFGRLAWDDYEREQAEASSTLGSLASKAKMVGKISITTLGALPIAVAHIKAENSFMDQFDKEYPGVFAEHIGEYDPALRSPLDFADTIVGARSNQA